ncbi:MAG: hypothetical protein JOZ17_11370 [Acetobacteraceae bacterium]|nr:hypothetical protein [Acetobacteraceae bacterium]
MRLGRTPVFLIPSCAATLLVVVGLAMWKGETRPVAPPSSSAFMDPVGPQPRALTAEEEAYEAAMWPIHREVIEGSAGTMTLAGITYVTEGRDLDKLVATVRPLERRFRDASARAHLIEPPSSMQAVHAQYLEAITLYHEASMEMLQMAEDGREQHLFDAQAKAQRAAESVVKAGDILWPGEHKPN